MKANESECTDLALPNKHQEIAIAGMIAIDYNFSFKILNF